MECHICFEAIDDNIIFTCAFCDRNSHDNCQLQWMQSLADRQVLNYSCFWCRRVDSAIVLPVGNPVLDILDLDDIDSLSDFDIFDIQDLDIIEFNEDSWDVLAVMNFYLEAGFGVNDYTALAMYEAGFLFDPPPPGQEYSLLPILATELDLVATEDPPVDIPVPRFWDVATITAYYNAQHYYVNRHQALELFELGFCFGGEPQSLLPVLALELDLNANAVPAHY